MKTTMKNPFILPALIAALGLMVAGQAAAQTFTTLHSFTVMNPGSDGTNGDGANPSGLIIAGHILCGTANNGGSGSNSTVWAFNTDDTNFTTLHSFTATSVPWSEGGTNSDGAEPSAGLILSGGTLYGMASYGGSFGGAGTVFAVNTESAGFTNVHNFTGGGGGAFPVGTLLVSGVTLFGTTELGGSSDVGMVFVVNTDGTDFTNLHNFPQDSGTLATNSDGFYPQGGLVLSGHRLYGAASDGGSAGNGTVWAVNTDGTGFTNLHNFTAVSGPLGTNSDGQYPNGGLILSGNTLYGTAYYGGSTGGNGTVFKLNTDGTGFTTLHSFSPGTANPHGTPTSSDGGLPFAGLILSGNTLYGTAFFGGSSGNGVVFKVNTDGSGFTTLYNFSAFILDSSLGVYTNSDGGNPGCPLILSGNTLYGTAEMGGTWGNGTVFSLTLPAPQLTLTTAGANVILTWPTNYAGFDDSGYTLQSTTNLESPTIWSTVSPTPAVVNGQFTVTNLVSGTEQVFRLSQ